MAPTTATTPVEAVPAAEAKESSKKNMCAVLGLNVAPSRCRGVLQRAYGVSQECKEGITAAKEQLASAKTALEAATAKVQKNATPAAKKAVESATEQVKTAKATIADLSKDHTRIAGETPVAAAAASDWIASNIASAALAQTQARGVKTVTIGDLHAAAEEADACAAFSLVKTLPAFAAWGKALRAGNAASVAKAVAAAKNAKEADATAAAAAESASDEAEAAAFSAIGYGKTDKGFKPVKVADAGEGADSGVNFYTYVGHACDSVRDKVPEYETLRFSKHFRTYLSTLVEQFMHSAAGLFRRTVAANKTSTLTTGNVMLVLDIILTHAGYADAAEELGAFIQEKVAAFQANKAEKAAAAAEKAAAAK